MCLKLGKIFLVIINVLFLIIASILIIVGAILHWGDKNVKDTIVNGISSLGGNQTLTFKDIAQVTDQYIAVLGDAGLIIFIFGVILFFISGCGFIGICCSNRIILIIYIIILTLLLILMVIFIIVFLVKRDDLKSSGQKSFLHTLTTKYTFRNMSVSTASPTGTDLSGIIDLIQINLKCCGVNNGTDFSIVTGYSEGSKIPYSCCITKGDKDVSPKYSNCTSSPSGVNSHFDKGCYSILWEFIEKYSNYASYALIGLSSFMFILIVISACLVRTYGKEKNEYA